MALAPGVRMHAEDGDLTGGAAGIRVLRGPDRAQADDLVTGAGDEQAVDAARWRREALPPRARERIGCVLGDDLVRDAPGVGLAEHHRLHEAYCGGVVDPGAADTGVGERAGTGGGRVAVSVVAVLVVAVPTVFMTAVVVLVGFGHRDHRPRKMGSRRSAKARRPSVRSSLAQALAKAAS